MKNVLQEKIKDVCSKTGITTKELSRNSGVRHEDILRLYNGSAQRIKGEMKFTKYLDEILESMPKRSITETEDGERSIDGNFKIALILKDSHRQYIMQLMSKVFLVFVPESLNNFSSLATYLKKHNESLIVITQQYFVRELQDIGKWRLALGANARMRIIVLPDKPLFDFSDPNRHDTYKQKLKQLPMLKSIIYSLDLAAPLQLTFL